MSVKSVIVRAMFCICAWAGAAMAQQQISPEAFLKRAAGQTLTFTDNASGQIVGIEQFLRPDLSVWAESNGRCSYGRIEIRGPLMCFIYESFPDPTNCWMPFDNNGQLMVISRSSFQVQRVTEINDTPVDCVGAPLS